MTSLYNRASPSQERLLRIVEGAVLNVADAHGLKRDARHARSVAKRAAGTISAQWTELLAASTRPSVGGAVSTSKCRACERRAYLRELRVRQQRGSSTLSLGLAERRAAQVVKRPPLVILWERLKRKMWHIVREGDPAKTEAYRDLLRMLDRLQRDMAAAEMEDHP